MAGRRAFKGAIKKTEKSYAKHATCQVEAIEVSCELT